jgi:serine/threonine-protein kinase RIO1
MSVSYRRYDIYDRCLPKVRFSQEQILIIGIHHTNTRAAPRLKDAVITREETYLSLYFKLTKILHTLFHRCKLIHADFSEYNLLYMKGDIYVIDVSQAVEHDHPHALEFLRSDVGNVVRYFRGALTGHIMTVREMFDFVVTPYDVLRAAVGCGDAVCDDDVVDMYLHTVLHLSDPRYGVCLILGMGYCLF